MGTDEDMSFDSSVHPSSTGLSDRIISLLEKLGDTKRLPPGLDLTGHRLRDADLSGLEADDVAMVGCDFRGSALGAIEWTGCQLTDANLDRVSATSAVFLLCELSDSRVTNAALRNVRIENCTARGARFDGADLTDAVLTETDFSRASFKDANLTRVSASATCFRGADLSGANLSGALLECADLRGADLTGAILDNVNFDGADLRGSVGDHPVLATAGRYGEAPSEPIDALADTMAPVVGELIRSAGESGLDPKLIEPLMADVEQLSTPTNTPFPNPETLQIVAGFIGRRGDNSLSMLMQALQLPKGEPPPPEIEDMILKLRGELGLDEAATAEDVLAALTGVNRDTQE